MWALNYFTDLAEDSAESGQKHCGSHPEVQPQRCSWQSLGSSTASGSQCNVPLQIVLQPAKTKGKKVLESLHCQDSDVCSKRQNVNGWQESSQEI